MTIVRVNVISESSYSIKGHGVHSVYEDNLKALRNIAGLEIVSGIWAKADIVHLHTVGLIAALVMRVSAPVSVVTAHITPSSMVGSIIGGRLLVLVAQRYLCWFYNAADLIIALSSEGENELRRIGVTSPITLVPNVVPDWQQGRSFSRRSVRRSIGIPANRKVILSVGQVQPRKAVATFHACAREMPEAIFIWVGGFPFGLLTAGYWKMRRLIKSKPENVIHTGRLAREDVRIFYAAADVYFHPSHHELGPVALLEAATMGLPLVVRDLECYRDAPSGSYSRGTEQTFTAQLQSLCDDPSVRDRRVEGACRLADSLPSGRAGEALAALYVELFPRGPLSE